MTFWHLLLLAVVQGVTEFLPISSSGHLVIVAGLLGMDGGELSDISDLNIVLHVGTLGSILVFYWQRIARLLTVDRRVVGLLLVGTVPAAGVGIPIKLAAESVLESATVAGAMLIVTGVMLFVASRISPGKRTYSELTWFDALVVGAFQAVAILPGISRSGATITAGLGRGLDRRSAATFAFLLAIPAIGGAGLIEAMSLMRGAELSTPVAWLAAGLAVSFAVGLVSLWWLTRWLERGRLALFAAWCIPLGIVVLVLF